MQFLNKVLAIGLASMISLVCLWAQDDRLDELPFEEEDIVESKSRQYGAVGGGFVANFTFMNTDELNSKLNEIGLGEFNGPLIQIGGQGFTVLPWIPNLRLGVIGMGGSMSTDQITDENTGISSSADYSYGYTGLSFDYGWVLTDGLALLAGTTVGYGQQTFSIYNGRDLTFEQITTRDPQNNLGVQEFSQDLILLSPQVNVEWAFTDLLMLRVGASYSLNLATSEDWSYNNISTISDMPDITPNGLNIQAGLFLGLFNY